MGADAVAHVLKGGAVTLVKADDEFRGDEAMNLGHALLISGHAERDNVDEVVVLVYPGSLSELGGRLDGYGMEVESVDEEARNVVIRARVVHIEIEPEERASCRGLFDRWVGYFGRRTVLSESSLHT
jgi:hypothetical protein